MIGSKLFDFVLEQMELKYGVVSSESVSCNFDEINDFIYPDTKTIELKYGDKSIICVAPENDCKVYFYIYKEVKNWK
jgi:hypothetical protein